MLAMDPLMRGQMGRALFFLGLGFALLALIIWGGYFFRVSNAKPGGVLNPSQCQERLSALGGSVSQDSGRLVVIWGSLEGGMETLGKASNATVMCPGWVLDSFCMGQACEVPGARVALKQPNS